MNFKRCKAESCRIPALFNADCCWHHLESKDDWRDELCRMVAGGVEIVDEFFQEADLSNLNLDGLSAVHCDFTAASFNSSSLVNARMTHSILKRCNIDGAVFDNADMEHTKCDGINGEDVGARGVNFRFSSAAHCCLTRSDFSGSDFSNSDWRYADLSQSSLVGVKALEWFAPWSRLTGVDAENADFESAVLGGGDLTELNAPSTIFRRANLVGVKAYMADFSNSNLYYARLTSAKLGGANLDNCEIKRTVFRTASLIDVSLEGTDQSLAIWDRTRF